MLLSSPLSKTRKSCQGPGEGFFRQLCSVEVVDSFGLLDVYALKTSLVDAYRKLFLAKYGKTWSRHNCSATSMEQQRDEDKGL
jgi:microsomal dipeptidase-like Zn-dependent dipeptidase